MSWFRVYGFSMSVILTHVSHKLCMVLPLILG